MKILYISLIGIGFICLGYATLLISGLISRLKPRNKHKVWALLRVFILLFMLSYVVGAIVIAVEEVPAINLVLSSVFFCGGVFVLIAMRSAGVQSEELERTIEKDLEKEILLKEIHHRVKNNLQIIISLLRLEKGKIEDSQALEAMSSSENRVFAMATLHESLYRSEKLSEVNFKDYTTQIIANLKSSLTTNARIETKLNLCNAKFTTDILIPLGLIMNEVISNAFKHGFSSLDEGWIEVHLIEVDGYTN